MADEDIAFVHEVTLTSATPKQMSRAMLGWAFGRRPMRILFGLAAVVLALLFYLGFKEHGLTMASRLFSTAVWAAAFTLGGALVLAALIYYGNRRNFAQSVLPGSVMRTGFGRDEFVTSNGLSSSRYSYRAVRSIDLRDGFVLIRYVGQPVMKVYPSELFPAAALERVRAGAHRG